MSKNDLLNIDIIAPSKDVISLIGKVSKLNIFEFSGSQEFEPEGLFSTKIFGSIGSTIRNDTFGYIDISIPILHPLIYDYLNTLSTFYTGIIQGKEKARFDGKDFVSDENGRSGLYFFLKHLPELELIDNDSDQRAHKIEMIRKYSNKKDMTKYILVLPAGMRDYTIKENNTPSEDEINNMYRTLISISNTIKNMSIDVEDESIDLYNAIIIKLQDTFLNIYLYIKDILDGKNGFLQSKWSKRSVKYGTRNVITPSTNLIKDLRSTNIIGPTDTVIGLHQYLGAISPIAKRLILNTISEVFDGESDKAYLYNPKTLKPELTPLSLKDKKDWTTYEGLDNLIEKFSQDDYKYLPVKIANKYLGLVKDTGDSVELFYNDEIEIDNNTRPITYIELLYIAIYHVRRKYPGMITRFPVDNMKSSYLTTFFIKVTIEDRNIKYKHNSIEIDMENYPLLDKKPFNSLSPHYTRLEGLGGDHDGDMVSAFVLYSDEAIEESNAILNDIKYILNPNGGLMNSVSIPPLDNVLLHLTDTMQDNLLYLTLSEANDMLGEEKINSYINKNSYKLKEENIYFILCDTSENILGIFGYCLVSKMFLDKSLLNISKLINNEYFIYVEDIKVNNDKLDNLLDYINKSIGVSYDIVVNTIIDISKYDYNKTKIENIWIKGIQ